MSVDTATGASAYHGQLMTSLLFTARAERVIDRPAADVWAVLTDWSAAAVRVWNPTVVAVRRISGEPQQENELVLVSKDPQQTTQSPLYLRVLRLVENRQRVLRVDAVDGSHCGFVDHSLYETHGRTTVLYSGYLENQGIPADQVKAFDSGAFTAGLMNYLNESLRLLKQAVEHGTPDSRF